MLPYFIIQSADWYFGPKLPSPSSPPEQQPHYVSAAALITFIFSITGNSERAYDPWKTQTYFSANLKVIAIRNWNAFFYFNLQTFNDTFIRVP